MEIIVSIIVLSGIIIWLCSVRIKQSQLSEKEKELRNEINILNQVIKMLEWEVKNPRPFKDGHILDGENDGWSVDYCRIDIKDFCNMKWIIQLKDCNGNFKTL